MDRMYPHSLDAERSVLGAALLSKAAFHEAATLLESEDFYRAAHARIFVEMRKLAAAGVEIDLLTLREALGSAGSLDECGGPAYIAHLVDGVPRSTNVRHYAAIVREHSRRRQALHIATDITEKLLDTSEPCAEVLEDGVRRLLRSVDVGQEEEPGAATIMRRRYQELAEGKQAEVIPTGFSEVDRLIGGVRRGNLTIVAARPSVGKTALALAIGEKMAEAGYGVLWCTLEMQAPELADRLLAWKSGVSIRDIEHDVADPAEYQRLAMSMDEVRDIPLFLVESARTLTQMTAWVHRLRGQGHKVDAIIVDYIQKMVPEKRLQDREREVAILSEGLKTIAKNEGLAMVALSQLRRPQAGKADKRPHMSDMRESGALEQDADVVALLYREEMHKPKTDNDGLAEVIIAKNRSGPVGVTKLYFYKRLAKFSDLTVGG